MIEAVIFDFDGLILDTETHEYEALQEIFREHGSELPMSVWGNVIGTASGFKPFEYLQDEIKRELDHELLTKRHRELVSGRLEKEIARPGVLEYLEAAKQLGLKIGLASSSHYAWVSGHLKNIGLFDYFECIKTADDVETVKPDPALYIEAAKCLGVDPANCLAFEDSVNGSLAAKRAGMSCVIVPNTVTRELAFEDFDHRLESMAELELALLIEELHTKRK
ncbi:HAD-IA family hydrolase [Bacillus lacus]|uniref:HAD-IA family hydrolase n=1 Tax=Metabacillus lacus TaxID=1983721 RepID=A0A7X2IXN3_9BACI|nr:HAD-IA family hydrolase [Metabacillus lacus]